MLSSTDFHPIFPTFPQQEYRFRIKRFQRAMEQHGCDVIMLTSPENIIYITGYQSWYFSSKFRPVVCFVPQKGEPVLVVRLLEKYNVEIVSWVRNIYCWGSSNRSYRNEIMADNMLKVCYSAICDIASSSATIGIEAGEGLRFNAPLSFLDDLRRVLPKASFIDGSVVIQVTRMVKSKFEVERIREACKITECAIKTAFSQIKPGIREKEIARIVDVEMAKGGIDKISYLTIVSGKEKYATFNAYATSRKVQDGDLILFDISGHYQGYASDLSRVAILGKATDEQRRMAKVSRLSVQKAIKKAIPGTPISEVSKVAEDVIKNYGYRDFLLHSSGHGIGLDVVEYPMITHNQSQIIEPGMVLSVEQGVYPYHLESGVSSIYMCFRSEDIMHITPQGAEYLSGPDSELTEL